MAAKLTRLTHKIAIQLHHLQLSLQAAQSGNFRIHPRTYSFSVIHSMPTTKVSWFSSVVLCTWRNKQILGWKAPRKENIW